MEECNLNLKPGQTLDLTVLDAAMPAMPGYVVESLWPQLRLTVNGPASFGAPVKIDIEDALVLGDVCHCEALQAGAFAITVTVRHRLPALGELRRLNRALEALQAAPVHAPEPVPSR